MGLNIKNQEPYRSVDHGELLYGEPLLSKGDDFRHTDIEPADE